MVQANAACRRDRILDAAEDAFAERGFAATSLRAIVRKAQVNLATVYYYFQSKNGLMAAVLKRRFGPLRTEHLELLRRLKRDARGRPLVVEKILEAMLLPPLRLALTEPARCHAVTRLIGRITTEPNPATQTILRRQRSEVRSAFLSALKASLPRSRMVELEWRLDFVWGALAFLLCNPDRLEGQKSGSRSAGDAEAVMAEMINFFAPGLRAAGTMRGRERCLGADGRNHTDRRESPRRVKARGLPLPGGRVPSRGGDFSRRV